jgi:hypothetical protein
VALTQRDYGALLSEQGDSRGSTLLAEAASTFEALGLNTVSLLGGLAPAAEDEAAESETEAEGAGGEAADREPLTPG